MEEEERREEVPVEWVDAQEWAAIELALASASKTLTASGFCNHSSWTLNGGRNEDIQRGNVSAQSVEDSVSSVAYNASNPAASKSSTPSDSSLHSHLNGARSEDIQQENGSSPPVEETLQDVVSSAFTTSHHFSNKESGKGIGAKIEETEEGKAKQSEDFETNSPIKRVEAHESAVIKISCAGASKSSTASDSSSWLHLHQEKGSILALENTRLHNSSDTPDQLKAGDLKNSQELLSCSSKNCIDHETSGPTKRPRRVLPQWGQIKASEAGVPKKDARSGKQFGTLEPELPSERLETSWPAIGQTNLSELTNSWPMTQSDCQGKVKFKAPLLQFRGRIVYSRSEEEVDAAAHELWEVVRAKKEVASGDVPIGFDMEWKASFQRGEAAGKVAVVQLCVESSRCDVMHIVHSGIPSSLASLLRDSSILKPSAACPAPLVQELAHFECTEMDASYAELNMRMCIQVIEGAMAAYPCHASKKLVGVGSFGDAVKLRRDYEVQTQGVVDLSILANQKLRTGSLNDPYTIKQWSLSSLAYELTCKQVEKVRSIRTGDWESWPLSQPQLLYAATDAFASLYLYQVLETFPNRVIKD